MLPAIERHWATVEPATMGVVSAIGSSIMIMLAPEATTAAEYGGIFVGFLIFLGLGVMGIAIATATYMAKGFMKAMADVGGSQATKVFNLHTQDQFDARFKAVETASAERSEAIVRVLDKISANLTEQTSTIALLKQEVQNQVARGDELRAAMLVDIKELQGATFERRSSDGHRT